MQDRQHLHLECSQSWSESFSRIGCQTKSQKPIHQLELDVFFWNCSWCTCPSYTILCLSGGVFVHNDLLYSFSVCEVNHLLSFVFEVTLIFVCRQPSTHWFNVRASHSCRSFGHDCTNASHRILSLSFSLCLYSCRTC